MGLLEETEKIYEGFGGLIKPCIEENRISDALEAVEHLVFYLRSQLKRYAYYHSGISFVASAIRLKEELEHDPSCVKDQIIKFEMNLRQLQLAIKSDNKYNDPFLFDFSSSFNRNIYIL